MKANFPLIQEDPQKAYSALLESPLDWTFVRVPMIEFTGEGNLKISAQGNIENRLLRVEYLFGGNQHSLIIRLQSPATKSL